MIFNGSDLGFKNSTKTNRVCKLNQLGRNSDLLSDAQFQIRQIMVNFSNSNDL